MSSTSPVIIRKSARFDIAMRAEMSLDKEHAMVVRFSAQTGAKDGWVEADAVDISMGGVGLMSLTFIPRGANLLVKLYGPKEGSPPILAFRAAVRRVIMTDRRPAYHVGTSFVDLSDDERTQLNTLLSQLDSDA